VERLEEPASPAGEAAVARVCGPCSLCCTVLRVDELRKLAGTPCVHQRAEGGCGIYVRRPGICRAYRCLWLSGGLDESDRPDRLGAVLDLVSRGGSPRLEICEARPGVFEASPRLREIAASYRESFPVHVAAAWDVLDPERPSLLLLPDGEEHHVHGDRLTIIRDGVRVGERRLHWLARLAYRLWIAFSARRLRSYRGGGAGPAP
jgi:hypothetical protein